MQETRQHILEILREIRQATVDDIVTELRKRRGEITAVTVRHHLTRLQQQSLISAPVLRHRDTPGRPQHVYEITEKAQEYFPDNYQRLAAGLIEQLRSQLSPETVTAILHGVADSMAAEARINGATPAQRREMAVNHLNRYGYNAAWEQGDGGDVLHIRNCPYHALAQINGALCSMDMQLMTALLGEKPRLVACAVRGELSCMYVLPRNIG